MAGSRLPWRARRIARRAASLAALALAAVSAAPDTYAAAAWPPREPVGHAGRWLVDADGRVLVPRGLNMVDKRPPYLPSLRGFGADDARFLRHHGFTTVRLGVIHKGFEPRRGEYDDAYIEDIAATVRMLHREGLMVLVDLHQDYFNEATGGEGFPDWMVIAPGPPTRPDAWPFDALWANARGFQDAVAAAWGRLARRLASEPGVLGYDLLNEPFPGSREGECAQVRGCEDFDREVLVPFYRRILAQVRAADPARLAFVEPHVIFNSGADSHVVGLPGERLGFSFHVYCREAPWYAGVPPCRERRPMAFDNAERISRRAGYALMLTEFGATDDTADIASVVDETDRRMLPWHEWAYWNHDPFAARPHEGLIRDIAQPPDPPNVKEEKLVVLARPYPRAVAGTPLGWAWDPAQRTFTARWSTASPAPGASTAGRHTEIVLPALAFPRGWRIAVQGGRALDSEGSVVRVVAHRASDEVSVRVDHGRPKARKRRPARKRDARSKRRPASERQAGSKRRPGSKRREPSPRDRGRGAVD